MIIKLTLETENPERILTFLEKFEYLRILPAPLDIMNDDQRVHKYMQEDRRYRHLFTTYGDYSDDTGDPIPCPISDEDQQWIRNRIREAFFSFTDDLYERSNFTVEIVDQCSGAWENGKAFYVFPSSYTDIPVLQF